MKLFIQKYWFSILSLLVVFALVALIEYSSGRSIFGPDGKFGLWDGNIWGSENSQRVADAYSFSHIIHGLLFYGFLWLVARKIPLQYRFLIALVIEGGWELLENSPIIINRYREATISLGYVGDSILNSVSDVGMMAIGFCIARTVRIWVSIAIIVIFEVGCLLWVRDNLTLNVLMLVHPVESIKTWQSEWHTN